MIKLLVENLMHLLVVRLVLVDLKNGVGERDTMLETGRGQFLVLLHEWANFIELALQETQTNAILVLVHLVPVEVLILLDQVLQILPHPEVRVDGEALGA